MGCKIVCHLVPSILKAWSAHFMRQLGTLNDFQTFDPLGLWWWIVRDNDFSVPGRSTIVFPNIPFSLKLDYILWCTMNYVLTRYIRFANDGEGHHTSILRNCLFTPDCHRFPSPATVQPCYRLFADQNFRWCQFCLLMPRPYRFASSQSDTYIPEALHLSLKIYVVATIIYYRHAIVYNSCLTKENRVWWGIYSFWFHAFSVTVVKMSQ